MLQESSPIPARRRRLPSAVLLLSFTILQLLLMAVAFLGGYFWRDGNLPESFLTPKFPLLTETLNLLQENAYFPLPDEKKLEYGMIRGMLAAYNEPFTVFVEPPQHELQTQRLEGKYGAIGVRVERDSTNNVYLYPLPGSPALKAGVLDGDRLFKVDSIEITAQTKSDEIQAAIRGPIDRKVTITIGHKPDFKPVALIIDRAETALPSTTWNLAPTEPQVGIVHVQVIADTTPTELTKAINDLESKGASRFVIDVRNNGGGLVDAGVNLARLFVKQGPVIEEQYRGQPVKPFTVDKPGKFADLPVVILVNRGTASAAEIFAGAIQGQKRAPIVGTRTYGKDTIQLVFTLSDGSSLHVTSAHWWVPGLAYKISGNGIQPDVSVPENAAENQDLQTAIETVLK